MRYIVVSAGKWLANRRVLLPPTTVEKRDWANGRLWIPLTQQQIVDSPEVDTDKPVSRQKEMELDRYAVWAPVGGIIPPPAALPADVVPPPQESKNVEGDSHLRSVNEVTSYHIQATDGSIGHVEELVMDDEGDRHSPWELRYFVANTRNWLPGREVLVAPRWAESINWAEKSVHFALTRQQIKDAPEYNADAPINRQYEEIIFDYYGRPKYWIEKSDK